ncbi:unnamed protein product, partial [Owenia fusiformis]
AEWRFSMTDMKVCLRLTLCLLYISIVVIQQTTAKRPPDNPRPRKILKALNRKKVIQDEYIVTLVNGLAPEEVQRHLDDTAHLYEIPNSRDIGHILKKRKRSTCVSERGQQNYFTKNGLQELVYSVFCMSDDDLETLDKDPLVKTLEEDERIGLGPKVKNYEEISDVENAYLTTRGRVRARSFRSRGSNPIRKIFGSIRRLTARRNRSRATFKSRIGMKGGGLKGSFTQLLQPQLENANESCFYEYISNFGQWGLDRIDAEHPDFDSAFSIGCSGDDVDIYIVDTGILNNHDAFRDAVTNKSRVIQGYSSVSFPDDDTTDYDGHGTHVAGVAGGHLYGVCTGANLIPVKVIDLDPETNEAVGTKTSLIEGLEWVKRMYRQRGRKAVVNLSIGGEKSVSVDDAVLSLVHEGITVVVAAGNNNTDACYDSPPDVREVIAVGCSTIGMKDGKPVDKMCPFSNYGACVDILAPGSAIQSSTISKGNPESTSETEVMSGTSMSSPFVAGAIACYLSVVDKTPTPAEVYEWLMKDSTMTGLVQMDDHQSTTSNRILSIPKCE